MDLSTTPGVNTAPIDWTKYSSTTPTTSPNTFLANPTGKTPMFYTNVTPTATVKPTEPSVIGSSDVNKKIAQYKEQLANYQRQYDQIAKDRQKTSTTTATPTTQTTPTTPTTETSTQDQGTPEVKQPTYKTREELLKQSIDESKSTYQTISSYLNPELQQQLSAINASFDALVLIQKQANQGQEAAVDTALMRTGSSRYSPISAAGISAEQIRYGATQLANIESQRQTAIANARAAAAKDSWDLVGKILGRVDDLEKQQQDLLTSQNANLQKQIRSAQISMAVSSAIDKGLTDPKQIFDVLSGEKTLSALNASSQEVKDAYSSLVSSPQQLGQDWSIYQELLKTGELQNLTGKQEPTLFDYLKLKDAATQNPTDPTLQAIRQVTLQKQLLQLQGYITLPTDANGQVKPTDIQYGSAMKFAMSQASEGQRIAYGQLFSEELASGNVDKVRSLILNTALDTSDATTQQKYRGMINTIDGLSNLARLIQKAADDGVNTSLLTGSLEDVERKIGKTTDPRLVELKSYTNSLLFSYRNALSGAAFSFKEGEMYAELFPNYWNDTKVNQTLVSSLTSSLSSQVDTFFRQKLSSDNYDFLMKDQNKLPGFDINVAKNAIAPDDSLDVDLINGSSQPGSSSYLGF